MDRAERRTQRQDSLVDQFFQEHVDAVHAYAFRRVNSEAVAEDLTAEVFSEAFQRPGRIPTADPRPWLFGIARRKVADHYRKQGVRREVPLATDLSVPADESIGSLLHEEATVQLRALVEALPMDQREALLLHYVEGFTAKQIAVTMRRSPFAVNSLLQRARNRIYEQGKAYFDDHGSNRK